MKQPDCGGVPPRLMRPIGFAVNWVNIQQGTPDFPGRCRWSSSMTRQGMCKLRQAVNLTAAGALGGGFWGSLVGLPPF